jgi:hypothetical protein
MKKLLLGIALLTSLSSFAGTVGDLEIGLANSVCGENFPTSDQEYSRAISVATGAKVDINTLLFSEIQDNGSMEETIIESERNISRHIDLMLTASMRNLIGLSNEKLIALDSLCDSLEN